MQFTNTTRTIQNGHSLLQLLISVQRCQFVRSWANLCDLGLLQKTLSLVKSHQGTTIVDSPSCGGDRHCLAIPLEITCPISGPFAGGIADNLLRMTEEKVEQWTRGLSSDRKSSVLPLESLSLRQVRRFSNSRYLMAEASVPINLEGQYLLFLSLYLVFLWLSCSKGLFLTSIVDLCLFQCL